jgi:hypothetical protein
MRFRCFSPKATEWWRALAWKKAMFTAYPCTLAMM